MGRLAKIYQKQAHVKLVGEVNFGEKHIFEALRPKHHHHQVRSSEQRCVFSRFSPMKTIYKVDKLGHFMTVKLGFPNERYVTEQKLQWNLLLVFFFIFLFYETDFNKIFLD